MGLEISFGSGVVVLSLEPFVPLRRQFLWSQVGSRAMGDVLWQLSQVG